MILSATAPVPNRIVHIYKQNSYNYNDAEPPPTLGWATKALSYWLRDVSGDHRHLGNLLVGREIVHRMLLYAFEESYE